MGGSISVQHPGVGTTFTVACRCPWARPWLPSPRQSGLQLPPLRILVVDDVPANIELLQIHLDRGPPDHHCPDGQRLSPPQWPV